MAFFPSCVGQFIIKLFDFKFFSCRFAEAESGMHFLVNFPPNRHSIFISNHRTKHLPRIQEDRDNIYTYIWIYMYMLENLIPLSILYFYILFFSMSTL